MVYGFEDKKNKSKKVNRYSASGKSSSIKTLPILAYFGLCKEMKGNKLRRQRHALVVTGA